MPNTEQKPGRKGPLVLDLPEALKFMLPMDFHGLRENRNRHQPEKHKQAVEKMNELVEEEFGLLDICTSLEKQKEGKNKNSLEGGSKAKEGGQKNG